jgi:hypothetical protein
MGFFYYADIYLGRASYFYYGLSSLLQNFQNMMGAQAHESDPRWGADSFRVADEAQLVEKYAAQLEDLDKVIPLYLDQVGDLAAIASARRAKVLYALQPELLVEKTENLSPQDAEIQAFAFQHHGDFGTLGWRYMESKVSAAVQSLSNEQFVTADLMTIADGQGKDLYTDYCHLTARGNQVIAEKLFPQVVEMLGLN